MRHLSPKLCFIVCNLAGFGLLFAFWLQSTETAGFFLLLILVVMTLLRWRIPNLEITIVLDITICFTMLTMWPHTSFILALPLFAAMYFRYYWAMPAGIAYLVLAFEPTLAAVFTVAIISGIFLGLWERERQEKLETRDKSLGKFYEMEILQSDLAAAVAQVERMTAVAERTRIARDIHDNAGHEIVAAYISLQTVREMMDDQNKDVLELYDAALERLNAGAGKIRDAVHNLSAITALGAENLQDICNRFPACNVAFRVHGDTARIPMYVWNMLVACLNECLTNVTRHSKATYVNVDLDATPHIARLCVENNGISARAGKAVGSGLRNLRHRAAAVGGSLSVDSRKVFRVICVIPLKEESNEITDS